MVKIESVVRHSEEELIARLKTVTMLTAPEVMPYKDASIVLRQVSVQNILPAQRYVLKENLERARELRVALIEFNIDLYNLEGYVSMQIGGEWVDLLPPILELWRNRLVLNDGMHRVYMAYLEEVAPTCVMISGIPEELPYYAHVIPGRDKWLIPRIVESTNDVPLKKWHRTTPIEAKELYRNFDSAFLNVGGPRG